MLGSVLPLVSMALAVGGVFVTAKIKKSTVKIAVSCLITIVAYAIYFCFQTILEQTLDGRASTLCVGFAVVCTLITVVYVLDYFKIQMQKQMSKLDEADGTEEVTAVEKEE